MDTQIQAVLFDMDGVIFDSEIKVIECWKDIAEKYGFGDIETPCYEALGTTREIAREIMLAHYGTGFPYDAYKDEMAALFHARYGEGRLPKKKGVEELLQFLHMHNLKVALASSTRKEVVIQELRDGGLLDYFDAVICGDMVARSKPAPDIFLKACEVLGVAPEHAVGIEDSYNGIRSAYAAGMRPIMVPDMAEPTPEMEELSEQILPSLLDVKEYLESRIKK